MKDPDTCITDVFSNYESVNFRSSQFSIDAGNWNEQNEKYEDIKSMKLSINSED